MAMQRDHYDAGFIHSVAGQMTMLFGGFAVVMVLAWFYV